MPALSTGYCGVHGPSVLGRAQLRESTRTLRGVVVHKLLQLHTVDGNSQLRQRPDQVLLADHAASRVAEKQT